MKEKPKVGQTLYSLRLGSKASRGGWKLTPVQVVSVGRKYFTCSPDGKPGWALRKYHLHNWTQATDWSADSALYASEQEWLDEKEAGEIHRRLGEIFSGWQSPNLSLGQLRAIEQIIKETTT